MSSIPSSKMKHAHAHDGDHPEQAQHPSHQAEAQGGQPPVGERAAENAGRTPELPQSAPAQTRDTSSAGAGLSGRAERLTGRAQHLAEEAVDAVKARPRTAAVIGAAIVAGAAALIGGPAAARKLRGEDEPAPKRKPAAKKPVAKKTATRKG